MRHDSSRAFFPGLPALSALPTIAPIRTLASRCEWAFRPRGFSHLARDSNGLPFPFCLYRVNSELENVARSSGRISIPTPRFAAIVAPALLTDLGQLLKLPFMVSVKLHVGGA